MENKKAFRLFPERYGYFPHIFSIYLFFPLYYLWQAPPVERVIGYVMFAAFVVSYRQIYYAKRSFVAWVLLQLTIIFILAAFYQMSYVYMGFFPANFIGMARTRQQFFALYLAFAGMIGMAFLIQWPSLEWSTSTVVSFLPTLILMFLFPIAGRGAQKQIELRRQLRQANEQIEELVKREERQRIARDLHDTLGHTLSLITLKSELVTKLIPKNPEQAQQEARDISQTSRAALKQVRELVSDMRATTIEEEIVQARAILEAAGISFAYERDGDGGFPLFTQNMLAMCLREAVTNVVKHSKATMCAVKLTVKAGEAVLFVEDNGVGRSCEDYSGNGLKGMEERLSFLEGALQFLSREKGTALRVTVPIIVRQDV